MLLADPTTGPARLQLLEGASPCERLERVFDDLGRWVPRATGYDDSLTDALSIEQFADLLADADKSEIAQLSAEAFRAEATREREEWDDNNRLRDELQVLHAELMLVTIALCAGED